MNVIFLGSGPFAAPALEMLARSEHRPRLVVTRPDRPGGRGRKPTPTPLGVRAQELGLTVVAPETANGAEPLAAMRALAPDVVIVADYGEILKKPLRELPRVGTFNLHASLLPRHRGAAPINWAILAGDAETGVTLFRIVQGLDQGPVLDRAATSIGPVETAGELEERLSHLAADLLARNLPRLSAGSFDETPQEESGATLAPKLGKDVGAIDWSQPPDRLSRLIRALSPRPGAFSFLLRAESPPERIRFLRAQEVSTLEAPPGSITRVTKHGFYVAAGGGEIEVLELQPAGKPPMTASGFLRGHPLGAGERFGASG